MGYYSPYTASSSIRQKYLRAVSHIVYVLHKPTMEIAFRGPWTHSLTLVRLPYLTTFSHCLERNSSRPLSLSNLIASCRSNVKNEPWIRIAPKPETAACQQTIRSIATMASSQSRRRRQQLSSIHGSLLHRIVHRAQSHQSCARYPEK